MSKPHELPDDQSHSAMQPRRPTPASSSTCKDGLARGRWAPGALMPSEAELVAQFGVSRMTVNRALRELQAEGLVTRAQGVGTFAAPLHRVSSTLTIRDLHEEIEARGHRHHAVVHVQRARTRRRRAGRTAGPGARRAGLPHADRAPRERRAAAVRRPLRQPGLRARLPRAWTSRAPRRRITCSRSAPLWRSAVLDRGRRGRRRRKPGCSASPPRALPRRHAGAPSARRARSRSRAWCTRARATARRQFRAMNSVRRRRRDCRLRRRGATAAAGRASCWPGLRGADWQLRISVAEIEADGPVLVASPACERWFAVLEGAGVALSPAAARARLTPDDGAAALRRRRGAPTVPPARRPDAGPQPDGAPRRRPARDAAPAGARSRADRCAAGAALYAGGAALCDGSALTVPRARLPGASAPPATCWIMRAPRLWMELDAMAPDSSGAMRASPRCDGRAALGLDRRRRAAGRGRAHRLGRRRAPTCPRGTQAAARTSTCGGALVTPGLIDCHTHLVYGGDRAREFELRLQGASYEEIARAGGGIRSTVAATRAASDDAAVRSSARRARALMAEGVTTLEIKSGYGLR